MRAGQRVDRAENGEETTETVSDEENGEVLKDFSDPDALAIESGGSVTLTAELSVQDAFDYDWKFAVGHSRDRES
jgi:hypothetical protein